MKTVKSVSSDAGNTSGPEIGSIHVTVVSVEHKPIYAAAGNDGQSYGQMLDAFIRETVEQGKRVTAFEIEINDDASYALEQAVRNGMY